MTAAVKQYDKLTDAPKTVKEAIDWLICIGGNDATRGRANDANCNALQGAIQKLTGSTSRTFTTAIKGLIQGLSKFIGYNNGTGKINGGGIIKNGSNGTGYTSAYQQGSAQWPTCVKGQCSCCTTSNNKCQCSTGPSTTPCNGQCCNTCDIRICAGIFVALVPALHRALEDLKKRCNEKGNGQQTINQDPIKGYFTALGYQEDKLNGQLKGNVVNTKLGSAISNLKSIKEKIESAFKSTDNKKKGFEATDKSIDTPNGSSSPKTVREMLLWLMGLPYCQHYKDLVGKLKEKSNDVLGSSTSSGRNQDNNPLAKQLSAVIFHLPTVFYSIEGNISYLKEVFDQFKKDGKLTFDYPDKGEDLLNTLSAYVAVCYPILKYLMQRCDKEGNGIRRTKRGAVGLSTTPTDEKDGAWGELMVSGNENNDAKQPKVAPGATAPPTALRDYLVFMGFQTPNGTVTGDQLHDKALAECFSDTMKTEDEDEDDKAGTTGTVRTGRSGATSKDQKLPALRKLAKHVLQGLYGPATGGASGGGSSPNGTTPTTIRQMMLWLIGLPLTDAYKGSNTASLFGQQGLVVTGIKNNDALKELEKGQSGTRSTRTTSTVTGKHFKQQLKDSIVGMIMLFQRIEGGLKSVLEFLKEGFKDGGAKEKFKYEGFNDNKTILDVLGSYVYKVHTQLRFLKVMCKTGKNDGGWQDCWYTRTGTASVGDSIQCSCALGSAYMPCPGMLTHFLNSTNEKNKFKLCEDGKQTEHLQMGFKGTYSSSNIKGSDIYDFLKELIEEIPTTPSTKSSPTTTSKPLSCVTQYCVAIGNMEPSSLGDHFDVFRELGNGMWKKIEENVKKELGGITQGDNDGQGASGKLQQALKAVMPGTHNGGTHPSDLRSLTGCHEGACTPYIASLSYGLYNFFDPTKLGSPANKIDWLYMKMSSLYGKLEKLNKTMKVTCDCCMADKTALCKGIIKCPSCLPQLYKVGLFFGDAEKLVGKGGVGPKNCIALRQVIEKVLQRTSTLMLLFTKIDETRFKPYLLFSAMVVHGKNGQLQVTGDKDINCYTYALGGEYEDTYLKEKKDEDKKTAEKNKSAREDALKCNCGSHTYTAPAAGKGTATVVTLTLYFHKDSVTTISLTVPHHGPAYNPLVRLYPRNLKSIVDWLLRIGQTRLGQEGSVASTNDALENNLGNIFPKIQTFLKEKDKDVFKQLVEGVMKLMGMVNQGNKEVGEEVDGKLKEVKDKIQKKLTSGADKFETTFDKILKFSPKDYIDEVIKDFGQKLSGLNGNKGDRSFECIAKSVSKCMEQAVEQIKQLATENKSEMEKYNVNDIPELNGTKIDDVTQLQNISNLQTLCNGFKTFHGVYTTVTGAFNSHLKTAQNQEPWTKITKCVEAFHKLGECASDLQTLGNYNKAEKMPKASKKLEKLYDKLDTVHEKLSVGDIQTFTEKVNEFIKELDEKQLKTKGMSELESALQINNGKSQNFDDIIRAYITNVISGMKSNHKECDIHLRVRNDLLQLSECLKVMCEVCGTGMTEFAEKLKECVLAAKGQLEKIKDVKDKLEKLKNDLEEINGGTKEKYEKEMKQKLNSAISTIHSLLSNPYIYQPQPIVKDSITENDTSTMTTYLKSLPDLIRDRYVLQKWKDSPEDFCGVQEFKGGIVKGSDINGITSVLKSLLKDTFHNNDTQFPITIHDFQVKSLIYNFCHKEAMENIIAGLDVMESVKDALEDDNQKPPQPPQPPQSQASLQWTNIKDKKEKLSPLLTKLSDNAYLRYFATHLRDSIGYHALSNTLGALEKVKEKLKESNGSGNPHGWDNIKDLLQKTAIDELYNRLSSLLDKLHREYIFEYPPFDWQKSCHRLVAPTGANRARRSTEPASPAAPSSPSTTCSMCVPSMAHIFVGFVPQMYRLFKMLREMTKENGYGRTHTLEFKNNGRDAKTTTMSSLAGILSREGWRLKLGSGISSGDDHPYDLNHEKTGAEICKFLESIITDTPTGALLAQRENNVSTTDSNSLKPLEQLFKAVMQHFRTKREELRQKRIEQLKKEFEEEQQRTKSGLTFQPPPPVLPSTVRQVLFWLHEMDTNKTFYDDMSKHIEALCERSNIKSDISQETILHVLKLSITQCLEVLATIEDPGRQNAQYYYELYTEEHYYAYPTVNIPLFFYTFVEKLMGAFLELNFVCVQCEFRATEGGWSDCHIGEVYNRAYEVQESVCCICHERKTVGTPIHAVTVSGSVVCPRPLSAFLFSDPKNQLKVPTDPNSRLPYMSKGTMPCGFQLKNKAITDAATPSDAHTPTPAPTSMTGSVLVEPLRKLVGGHVTGRLGTSTRNTLSTVIYLRDLLRYTLCLAVRPPWSMSENMAFFYRVTESWKDKKGVGGVTVAQPNTQLLKSIHNEISLFPGTFKAELLTTAVERFAGWEDKNEHATSAPELNGKHHFDLKTLMGCQDTNTAPVTGTTPVLCSPFMFPLSLDVYTHYDHKNSRAYLSWILNFAFGIYGQLKALEEMIKGSACVRNGSQSPSSSCPLLPMCPGVLTALYQSGSSFMDQGQLAKNTNAGGTTTTTKKTCRDFHSVLNALFNCETSSCTPLHNLIVQCEAFLWSIRLPFSLVQLSLWSVAILFISYVFVVPLDHFKIKSHLFNRLKYTMHPSLLIADQQRRVSEVAYFSL